jgi:hypothetical protein
MSVLMFLALVQDEPVGLEQLRQGPRGLAPFPRLLRVAVSPMQGLASAGPEVLEALDAYYRRWSRGRFFLQWQRASSVPCAADLDAIRIGSREELALVGPWIEAVLERCSADAVCLLVPRAGAKRGWFRWPHEGVLALGRRRVPYYVAWPDTGKLETVGVHAHEIGHLVGLEDEYEHQEVEEASWCVMSRGYGGGDPPGSDPAPPCAPCRVRLGWMEQVAVSPESALRVRFDASDVCLSVGGSMLVERRDDRFLVWDEGRLAGMPGPDRWIDGREVRLRAPSAQLLELEPRVARGRFILIGEPPPSR